MRRVLPVLLLLTTGLAFASGGSLIPELGEPPPRTEPSRATLDDKDSADAAVEGLLRQGTAGTRRLVEIALGKGELPARGRAIVGLARAKGDAADVALETLRSASKEKQLVRTWAYAATLQRATNLDTVITLVKQQASYPGSERAIELAMARHLGDAEAEQLLELLVNVPSLAGALAPSLLEASIPELGRIMLTHESDPIRRQAASWLAAQASQKERVDAVARITIAQLEHNPKVGRVPWKGGALYIPGIQWDRKNARALVRTLIQWRLYCEKNGFEGEKGQVVNNLRSVQLLRAAGFKNAWPNDQQVLEEWAAIAGQADVKALRREQGWD